MIRLRLLQFRKHIPKFSNQQTEAIIGIEAAWIHHTGLMRKKQNYIRKIVFDIEIINPGLAFISCEDGQLMRSNDLFETYEKIKLDADNDFIYLDFLDERYGITGGYTKLFKTSDGGDTWNEIKFPEGINSCSAVNILTEEKFFFQGIDNNLNSFYAVTENGGLDWELKPREDTLYVATYGSYFVDDMTGFWVGFRKYDKYGMVGDESLIYKTSDGGKNWESNLDTSFQIPNSLEYIDLYNENIGAGCGLNRWSQTPVHCREGRGGVHSPPKSITKG